VSEIVLLCFLFAFFVELKAIEYKPQPNIYAACSIAAWVAFIVGLALMLIL
jgi:hypothetical protein